MHPSLVDLVASITNMFISSLFVLSKQGLHGRVVAIEHRLSEATRRCTAYVLGFHRLTTKLEVLSTVTLLRVDWTRNRHSEVIACP